MGEEIINGEVEEVEALEIINGSEALTAVDKASIDAQVATAKQYPRSIARARREAMMLATLDEETAGSMFYALPRKGKTIEGPSARLAEVMAYSWGNLRVDADIVAEDRTHVTAMGTCFDVERNVAVRVRVKRRITDRHGKRYSEDMIGVTSNAAISIALRNAVFKVIPMTFVKQIYNAARRASLGEGGTMAQKRQKAIEWFSKLGVSESQLFELLSVQGLDDMNEDHLITLRGLVTAIQDGDTTVEHAFRRHDVSNGAEELNEALASRAEPEKEKPAKKRGRPKKVPTDLDGLFRAIKKTDSEKELSDLINNTVEIWEGLVGDEMAEFLMAKDIKSNELREKQG